MLFVAINGKAQRLAADETPGSKGQGHLIKLPRLRRSRRLATERSADVSRCQTDGVAEGEWQPAGYDIAVVRPRVENQAWKGAVNAAAGDVAARGIERDARDAGAPFSEVPNGIFIRIDEIEIRETAIGSRRHDHRSVVILLARLAP